MLIRANPASLRTRTLFTFLTMLVVLVVILQILAESIMGRGYRAVEEQTVRDRVEQANNALSNSIASLGRVNRDYAVWDDSYAFVTNRNPAYIATNLMDSTFINLGISYIAFVKTSGELVYAQAFDLATEQAVHAPPELFSFDGASLRLLQPAGFDDTIAGLVFVGNQPMLLSAHLILTSLGEGPPAGTLLMGRMLDAHELAQLTEITHLPIAVARFDDPSLAPELHRASVALAHEQPIVIIPLNNQRIIGATRVVDLRGGPGLLLYLELPRDVYQLGQQARSEYTLVLISAGLLFGGIAFWMLERTVLNRTLALSTQVAAIDGGKYDAQVTVGGSDEIGQLGNTINQMLGRLAQAQQYLIESELRYRQLIEIIPDAIIVHDGQEVYYTNPAGARLLGSATAETAIGRRIDPTIGAITARADGSPMLVDKLLSQPDGSLIAAELVVLPFLNHDQPATQVIVRNITERKQVEYALREAKEAADAASRAKSHFLSTMSHELRTPLTAIIGYAELLERTLDASVSAESLRDLGRIRASGAHLLAIINDVLDLSKIESGRMSVDHAPVALEPLLQTAVNTVHPLADRNGNRLVVYGATTAGMVMTDEVHLRQILINLLGNACKFTHQGTVTLMVTTQPALTEGESEKVLFAIQDTGIGIRPEQMGLLFRDFVQGDSSVTRKYGGTGLGLSLSLRLAHLLGGEITVTSEPEVGSTFTLTLPRVLREGGSATLEGADFPAEQIIAGSDAPPLAR